MSGLRPVLTTAGLGLGLRIAVAVARPGLLAAKLWMALMVAALTVRETLGYELQVSFLI